MIDAAIVGLGRWGQSLTDAIQGKSERIRFAWGVDTAPDAVRHVAKRGGFRLSPDFEQVLADPELQAIVLATPHSLHREQVIRCARAGKHVFCEKPLALRSADALEMIEACRGAGVVLGVGHNRRFWPAMRELRRIAASGELGQLLHIEGHNSNEHSNNVLGGWRMSPQESPGGGMTGAGLHALDAFISLVGPVRRVHAQLVVRNPDPPVLDTVSALYEFANGVSGVLASIRATPFYWRIHLFGSAGSAEVLGEHELVLRKSGASPQRISLAKFDSLRAELEAFADAAEGRNPFPVEPRELLATVEAFEASITSIESGQTVSLA